MFDLGGFFQNMGDMLKLVRDEDFQKFFNHPQVRELMKDEDFKKAVQEKNLFRLSAHPQFSRLLQDPEIHSALEGMARKFQKNLNFFSPAPL